MSMNRTSVCNNDVMTNEKQRAPLHHFEQLDVEIIDNELQLLLLSVKTSKLLVQKLIVPFILHYRTNNNATTNNDEKDIISLVSMAVIKSIIYFTTVGCNDTPTPAMSLLGLKYDYNIPPSNNSGRIKFQKKVLLYIFSIVLPSIEQHLRNTVLPERNMNHDVNVSPNVTITTNSSTSNTQPSTLETIAYDRRKSMLRFLLVLLDFTRVVNYVQFLLNDESTNIPPLLCLRLLGISYCRDENSINGISSGGTTRVINYIYAYRRILYSELFRCFVHIFPKDGFIQVFNQISNMLQKGKKSISNLSKYIFKNKNITDSMKNDTNSNPFSSCPICQSCPIIHPYVIDPCKHIYCYVCLRNTIMDNMSYYCIVCGVKMQTSHPLCVDNATNKLKNV